MRPKNTPVEFWAKVRAVPGECWLWQGHKLNNGYGGVRWAGKTERAHRVAYALHHGSIPSGLVIRHTCDVPSCCNPDHLLLGSVADNNRDKADRKRARGGKVFGSENHRAKLTEADVARIWALKGAGLLNRQIAELLGRPVSTIGSVTSGRNWGHLRTALRGE